jgi:hypothetical protein
VTGLPSIPLTTYDVRVRHADDGNQITAPVGLRIATYSPSRLRIDYVRIFDNVLSPLPPVVTSGGLYNQDAASGGVPYLQLLPADRWGSFSGTAAKAFSNSSYVGVVNTTKVLAATYAGPSATLRIEVPNGGATVILYTGVAIATNTNRLLVCANDVTGTDTTPIPAPVDCNIVTDLRTANQIILNSTNLPALANAGATKTISLTFRALTPGLFRIDGFQVIRGATLTAGIYDDFLAGTTNVLATTGTWDFAPSTLSKLAAAYGGTQALAKTTGATMTFNFQGSGFGVFTTLDSVGVDMRLCYKLFSNGTAFPASTVLNQNGKGAAGTAAAITCHTYTTDTSTVITDWSAKNGNIPRPALGNSYGFDIHGLVNNTYTAEIRLVRPAVAVPPSLPVALAATDRLKIDAIVVFSDITVGGTVLTSVPSGQYYDNTAAGIRYEPAPFWTSVKTTTGPTTGPWNLTEHTTTRAGAMAQFNMNGNGFILYQTAKSTTSKFVRVCVRTNLGQECSEFAQSAAAAKYFSPIAFYGLGTALSHEIVIENRDYGRILSIDGLKIIP